MKVYYEVEIYKDAFPQEVFDISLMFMGHYRELLIHKRVTEKYYENEVPKHLKRHFKKVEYEFRMPAIGNDV